ncbi:MAG: molecular chaperone DnaJ, partial [Actinomycetota bacterium]
EVLSDENQRASYDRGGDAGFGLGDIFESFFGGGARGPQSRAQRGQDALLRVDLELDEAIFGVEKTLNIDTAILCETCHGSCCKPGTSARVCDICRGSGQIQRQVQSFMGMMVTTTPCGSCRGTGEVIPDPCISCRGQGRVRAKRELDLEIPAGVADGMRLHLAGQGEVGFAGGPAGDIPVADAALGFKTEIDTFDGSTSLEVKPGAQHGDTITVKGLGATRIRGRGRGDLNIQLKVLTPTRLDSGAKALFQKLREHHREDSPRLGSRRTKGRF